MAKMKTNAPARKVVSGSLGAAVAGIVIYILNTHVLNEPLPIEVTGFVTTVVVFLVGYFVPPSANDSLEGYVPEQDLPAPASPAEA